MELFTKSQILTKRYIRYAGDHYCTVGLVQTYEGQTMLYFKSDYPILKHVTTDPKYSDWLFKNHFDLLDLSFGNMNTSNMEWYYDLHDNSCRFTEFKSILQKFNEIR